MCQSNFGESIQQIHATLLLSSCTISSNPLHGTKISNKYVRNCAEIRIIPSESKEEEEDDENDSYNDGADTEIEGENTLESSSSNNSNSSFHQHDLNNDGTISHAESFVAMSNQSFYTIESASESLITSVILQPTDDAVIRRGYTSVNFSGKEELKFDGLPLTSSLLRFDLSSVADSNIHSAMLRLYAIGNNIEAEGVNLHAVAGDWDEKSVTWDTAPSDVGPQSVKIKSSEKIPANSWYEVDFTDGVLWSIEEGDRADVTIKLATRKKVGGSFASKEYKGGMYSPKLIVDVSGSGGVQLRASKKKQKPSKPKKKKKPGKNKPKKNKPNKDKLDNDKKKPNKNKPDKNKPDKKKPNKNEVDKNKPNKNKPNKNKPNKNKPNKDKPNKNKPEKNKPSKNKPDKNKPNKNKPNKNKPDKDKPSKNKPDKNKPSKNKPEKNKPSKNKPDKDKPDMDKPDKPTSAVSNSSAKKALDILKSKESKIDNELFLYQSPGGEWVPSTIYKYDGLEKGLKVMITKGVAGMKFYLGDDSSNGHKKGLVNVAAFLAQSMKETIKYDACDENSWDLIDGRYPLSNACGQLGQSYQDYHCPPHEKHMECPVDKNMEVTAVTHAKWYD